MAAGRSCLITILPLLGTVVAIVLAIIAFLGSCPKANALRSLYFMRIDFTGINADSIDGLSGIAASTVNTIASQVLHRAGIPDMYDVGGTGYCQGELSSNQVHISNCTTPSVPFWFDLQSILEDHLTAGVKINIPGKIKDYTKLLHSASVAAWICYVAGIVVSVVELFIGIFSMHSRMASFCSSIVGFIAAILLLLASGLTTGIYVTYSRYFNQEMDSFGVKASVGRSAFIITWIATGASVWACVWWLISICFGSTSRRSRAPMSEEKEPFIGYVPHPHSNRY